MSLPHRSPGRWRCSGGGETGFETGTGVTVKISEGCFVLMADCNEVQELREQLYQARQVVKGIKDGVFSVLNES